MLYPARWKKITVDQSKVLKIRLFRFFGATRYKPRLHIGGSDGGSWRFGIPQCSARNVLTPYSIPSHPSLIRSDPWRPQGTARKKLTMFNFSWRSWRFEMDRVHSRRYPPVVTRCYHVVITDDGVLYTVNGVANANEHGERRCEREWTRSISNRHEILNMVNFSARRCVNGALVSI